MQHEIAYMVITKVRIVELHYQRNLLTYSKDTERMVWFLLFDELQNIEMTKSLYLLTSGKVNKRRIHLFLNLLIWCIQYIRIFNIFFICVSTDTTINSIPIDIVLTTSDVPCSCHYCWDRLSECKTWYNREIGYSFEHPLDHTLRGQRNNTLLLMELLRIDSSLARASLCSKAKHVLRWQYLHNMLITNVNDENVIFVEGGIGQCSGRKSLQVDCMLKIAQ